MSIGASGAVFLSRWRWGQAQQGEGGREVVSTGPDGEQMAYNLAVAEIGELDLRENARILDRRPRRPECARSGPAGGSAGVCRMAPSGRTALVGVSCANAWHRRRGSVAADREGRRWRSGAPGNQTRPALPPAVPRPEDGRDRPPSADKVAGRRPRTGLDDCATTQWRSEKPRQRAAFGLWIKMKRWALNATNARYNIEINTLK